MRVVMNARRITDLIKIEGAREARSSTRTRPQGLATLRMSARPQGCKLQDTSEGPLGDAVLRSQ
jgi:hypothetical protein